MFFLFSFLRWRPWGTRRDEGDVELASAVTSPNREEGKRIEDHRAGYPQLSALLGAYDFFFAFRSFRKLRARLLLRKQDELALLEQELDRIDREETSPLFLGRIRSDCNEARTAVLAQIDTSLRDFDGLAERTHRALSYSCAGPRDVESLRNWIEGTASVDEDETQYLSRRLMSLASHSDSATKQLEDWVEDLLIGHFQNFREIIGRRISTNSDVFIYNGALIRRTAKTIMVFLIVFILLMPVVLCIVIDNPAARVFVIVLSTALYLIVVAHLTRSKMMELIIAGATFATILTVFISNINDNQD